MVSNPGGGGLVGSVERCLELCGGHVAAVAVERLLVRVGLLPTKADGPSEGGSDGGAS